MSNVPDPLPVGYKIGRYVVEAELARAGMGRVYRASDPLRGSPVAINILAAEQHSREEAAFFAHVQRAYAKYRQQHGDDLARIPILDLFVLEGLTGVVVAYSDDIGAVLDVAQE